MPSDKTKIIIQQIYLTDSFLNVYMRIVVEILDLFLPFRTDSQHSI